MNQKLLYVLISLLLIIGLFLVCSKYFVRPLKFTYIYKNPLQEDSFIFSHKYSLLVFSEYQNDISNLVLFDLKTNTVITRYPIDISGMKEFIPDDYLILDTNNGHSTVGYSLGEKKTITLDSEADKIKLVGTNKIYTLNGFNSSRYKDLTIDCAASSQHVEAIDNTGNKIILNNKFKPGFTEGGSIQVTLTIKTVEGYEKSVSIPSTARCMFISPFRERTIILLGASGIIEVVY